MNKKEPKNETELRHQIDNINQFIREKRLEVEEALLQRTTLENDLFCLRYNRGER